LLQLNQGPCNERLRAAGPARCRLVQLRPLVMEVSALA
jgi:hypothetical protein